MGKASTAALLTLLAHSLWIAACRPRLSEPAQVVSARWLATDCEGEQHAQLEADLLKYKDELEPYFIDALKRGPSPAQIDELEKAANEQFVDRQKALQAGATFGLKGQELQRLRDNVTRVQYVAQETEDYVLRYKSRAVAGLGIVDGPKAKTVLTALSQDTNSSLGISAKEALSRINGPVKRGK